MRFHPLALAALLLWPTISPPPAVAQTRIVEEVPRRAEAGVRRRIWMMWDIDERCDTYRGFSVQVLRQPRAGRIELEKVNETVTPQWINPRIPPHMRARIQACIGQSVPIIAVFYTAHGRPGTIDTPVITNKNPRTGFERRINFQILTE